MGAIDNTHIFVSKLYGAFLENTFTIKLGITILEFK